MGDMDMGDMNWKWNCCTIYFPSGTCQLICLRGKKKKLIMYTQATKGQGLKLCNLTRCTVLCCFNIPWTPREETSVKFIPTSFKNPICKEKVEKLVIRSSVQVVDVNSSYYKKVLSYNVLVSQFGVNQISVLKNIFWFSVYSIRYNPENVYQQWPLSMHQHLNSMILWL